MEAAYQNKRGINMYIREDLQVTGEGDLVKWHVRNKSGVYREQGGRAHTTRETVSYPYKNPSGYHDIPRSMIRESCSKGYNIIVIVSDFNAATIDWDSWNDQTYRDIQFIVLLHENYLHQHIDKQARNRHGQRPSLVDILIANKELLPDITYMDLLGKSDKLCISFV